jgi:hypothetical protein
MSHPAVHLPIQYRALSRVARYGTTHHGHTVLDTRLRRGDPISKAACPGPETNNDL